MKSGAVLWLWAAVAIVVLLLLASMLRIPTTAAEAAAAAAGERALAAALTPHAPWSPKQLARWRAVEAGPHGLPTILVLILVEDAAAGGAAARAVLAAAANPWRVKVALLDLTPEARLGPVTHKGRLPPLPSNALSAAIGAALLSTALGSHITAVHSPTLLAALAEGAPGAPLNPAAALAHLLRAHAHDAGPADYALTLRADVRLPPDWDVALLAQDAALRAATAAASAGAGSAAASSLQHPQKEPHPAGLTLTFAGGKPGFMVVQGTRDGLPQLAVRPFATAGWAGPAPWPSTDVLFGPYDAIASALEAVPAALPLPLESLWLAQRSSSVGEWYTAALPHVEAGARPPLDALAGAAAAAALAEAASAAALAEAARASGGGSTNSSTNQSVGVAPALPPVPTATAAALVAARAMTWTPDADVGLADAASVSEVLARYGSQGELRAWLHHTTK